MSRWLELQRGRRAAGDTGFTVIELVVSITLLAIVAAAAVPLLVIGAKAANAAKLHTQAKNLSQQRLEAMRDMQFHVDYQNGPFVDMLDVYYTNLSATSVTRVRGSETMVDKWFSDSDTTGRTSLDPSGAFFKVKVDQLPGYSQFSQTIDTQFLNVAGSAVGTSSLSGYNSQAEGSDAPPTLMVGVTVITSWSDHGATHSYSNYTRITDSRGITSLVTSQGSGELLRLTSATPAGSAITVDVAQARTDGNVTTGSTATAQATALNAVDGTSTYTGATGLAQYPTASGSINSPVSNVGSSGCPSLATAVSTAVSGISATSTGALPKVPSNVDTASPPANQTAASLLANGGGSGKCGLFSFGNESTSYDSALGLDPTFPLVRLPNVGGNASVASGSAWVNATTDQTLPHSVSAGAGVTTSQKIQLFPGASFVQSTNGGDGQGLVDITLTANLACTSTFNSSSTSSGVTSAASGSWSAVIDVWTAAGRRYVTPTGLSTTATTLTWSSSSSSPDPLASLTPGSIQVGTNNGSPVYLSSYISSWNTAQAIADGSSVTQNSGVHQLPGIISLASAPVRSGDPLSAVGIQIGNLSCAAEDNR